MAATILAENFHAAPIGIGLASYCALDAIVETWPTASRVELVVGPIERGVAVATEVGAGPVVVIQFAGSRTFCSFMENDACFFVGKWIQWCRHKTAPGVEILQSYTEPVFPPSHSSSGSNRLRDSPGITARLAYPRPVPDDRLLVREKSPFGRGYSFQATAGNP